MNITLADLKNNNESFNKLLSTFKLVEDGTDVALGNSSISATSAVLKIFEHSITAETDCNLNPPRPKIIPKKEKITRFSKSSRRTLWKVLSRIQFKKLHHGFFITLTYHDNFPVEKEKFKADIKYYLDRLKHVFPEIRYLWKLEFQKRGAPHFHLMTFFPKYYKIEDYSIFFLCIRKSWFDRSGCSCVSCMKRAVDIRPISSYRSASSYLGKYMAKVDDDLIIDFPGRFWGKSADLPIQEEILIRLTSDEFLRVRSLAKRLLKSRGVISATWLDNLGSNGSLWVMLQGDLMENFRSEVWEILGKPYQYSDFFS